MAAEEMTEAVYNVSPNLGGKIMKFEFTGVTTGDWVIFDDPVGAVKATLATGGDAATLYATCAAHTGGASATATTMLYDTATAEQLPTSGYLMINNEIIKYSGVTKADTDGTFTLDSRGCFGTEAAVHAENDIGYILNTVVFTLGTVGLVRGIADIIEE